MNDTRRYNAATITIRIANGADAARLVKLAGLDSAPAPSGEVLVAEVGGDLRAALSLDDGTHVADPFHRTSELVEMLRIRAGAQRATARPGVRVAMSRPRRARLAFRTAG